MWVRGLKQHERIYSKYINMSHPMWVRGLKHYVIIMYKFVS